ncbi:MAG: dihydropyrimidinase [Gammaproteobacteria bacterium]|nr:dihydropyrimidinase [Gammaproteobacteria bacterium]
MHAHQLVVRNARVATASDCFECDIGIDDGEITALARDLPPGEREIDAAGRVVTPGGIDGHCHIDQVSGDGSVCADDFTSATRSAACGGTTTVMPFAVQQAGMTLREAVNDYHARAEGKALVDYSFHLILNDVNEAVLGQELPALIHDGYTSFKVYMTYDDLRLNDTEILDVLAVARREQAMVMVHAENADAIGWLTTRLERAGMTQPHHHATSRPMAVEREATHRAITLAELVDVPILIVHVSGREAIEQIRWAQGRGLKIFAETCPQYLFLTEDDLRKDGFEGAKCICSPPPRDAKNQEIVWEALCNGTFAVFSSDHAPTRFDDPKGKKLRGETASFKWVPNGVPGLETRLPLLYSHGVLTGRISINEFVALTATNVAKMYGLERKGRIAVGADADLVIWDEGTPRLISNQMLHHDVDYTPYEGMQVNAWPACTLSRGVVVWDGQAPAALHEHGRFIVADKPAPARPRGRFVSELHFD